ncbi:MAG: hypothetical protein ACR2PK_15270, partial [Acidimicrobiales bacterium]
EVDGLDLAGESVESAAEAAAAAATAGARPLSDLRASEQYRAHTVGVMARRAVRAAALRAAGEQVSVPVNRASGIGEPR